jgi:hypothetical protein
MWIELHEGDVEECYDVWEWMELADTVVLIEDFGIIRVDSLSFPGTSVAPFMQNALLNDTQENL